MLEATPLAPNVFSFNSTTAADAFVDNSSPTTETRCDAASLIPEDFWPTRPEVLDAEAATTAADAEAEATAAEAEAETLVADEDTMDLIPANLCPTFDVAWAREPVDWEDVAGVVNEAPSNLPARGAGLNAGIDRASPLLGIAQAVSEEQEGAATAHVLCSINISCNRSRVHAISIASSA